MDHRRVLAAAKAYRAAAQQEHAVPLRLERRVDGERDVRQRPSHPDHGGGRDGAVHCFIVQANVATDDRYVERETGLAQPLDGLPKRVGHRRTLRIGEVQAVRGGQRQRAAAAQVARRLGQGERGAAAWVERGVARGAVDGQRQALPRAADA